MSVIFGTLCIVVSVQVMKFDSSSSALTLVLGKRFVPGYDSQHFCQPTDVAVMNDGDIYVADGSVYLLSKFIPSFSNTKVFCAI